MDPRRPAPRPPSTTTSTSTSTSHRRTLFPPSRAARRANPSTMSSQSSLSTLHIPAEEADPAHDIVAKDDTGAYVLERPQVSAVAAGSGGLELERKWAEAMDNSEEEQIEAVIEMHGKTDIHWDDEVVQSDIKRALAVSLEKKVGNLEEDKWMFEGDAKFGG